MPAVKATGAEGAEEEAVEEAVLPETVEVQVGEEPAEDRMDIPVAVPGATQAEKVAGTGARAGALMVAQVERKVAVVHTLMMTEAVARAEQGVVTAPARGKAISPPTTQYTWAEVAEQAEGEEEEEATERPAEEAGAAVVQVTGGAAVSG
jgi:hypothetical protein